MPNNFKQDIMMAFALLKFVSRSIDINEMLFVVRGLWVFWSTRNLYTKLLLISRVIPWEVSEFSSENGVF